MVEALIKYEDFKSLRKDLSSYARENATLSSNAEFVAGEVYNRKLEDGKAEDFYDRMSAMAIDIASAEVAYMSEDLSYGKKLAKVKREARENLELYVSNKFRANTPTNINMGRWRPTYDADGEQTGYEVGSQMGSACFVVPVDDTFGKSVESLDGGLLEAIVTQQQLHKHGGGTGFSMARLRPTGSVIGYDPVVDGMKSIDWSSNRGVSSGPKSFLEHYLNATTEAVKQGNSRRGANMGVQRIDHMDFLDHMYAKVGTGLQNEFKIKNFNLSMGVTDEFMEAAVKGETYTLFNPHRADPRIKRILEKKHGAKNAEIVRSHDLATREQFETIMAKNAENPFNPVTTPSMYLDNDGKTIVNAYTGKDIGTVVNGTAQIDARSVLEEFSKLAHSNGEPGLVFLDRMNQYNSVLFEGEIEATNPCGEQPLRDNEACNLGSINAGEFVKYETFKNRDELEKFNEASKVLDDRFTKTETRSDGTLGLMYFDWKDLNKTIKKATKFLDDVIDRSEFPAEKVTKAVNETRKIGLGYMGPADAMMLMKMRYGSEESLEFADALAKTLYEETFKASKSLASQRGVFPLWDVSFYNKDSELHNWKKDNPGKVKDKFRGERELSDLVDGDYPMKLTGKVRNACRTTQAPTGTIRRTTGQKIDGKDNLAISSGIEPMYTLTSEDKILNTVVKDDSLAAYKLLKREGLEVDKIMSAIRDNQGSAFIYSYTNPETAKVLETIPEDVRDVLVTAAGGEEDSYEISKEQHAAMLNTFQRWNDSAISKTLNLPKTAQVEDMGEFYIDLWKSGVKGGTVYVDSSRSFQILNTSKGIENIVQNGNSKFDRALTQKSFTIELPYIDSKKAASSDRGEVDQDPGSVFTTVTYDERGRMTGVFQNVTEVNPEILSAIGSRNIELSRSMKNGRTLPDIIDDFERQKVTGAKRGVIADKGVMQMKETPNEKLRHMIEGGTTTEALLNSLYMVNFLTKAGMQFDGADLNSRWAAYRTGDITLRSIINTGGQMEISADEKSRPSIFGAEKIIKPNAGVSPELCPECL